jgi:hypothetical protein
MLKRQKDYFDARVLVPENNTRAMEEMGIRILRMSDTLKRYGLSVSKGPIGRTSKRACPRIVIGPAIEKSKIPFSVARDGVVQHCVAFQERGELSPESLKEVLQKNGFRVSIVIV